MPATQASESSFVDVRPLDVLPLVIVAPAAAVAVFWLGSARPWSPWTIAWISAVSAGVLGVPVIASSGGSPALGRPDGASASAGRPTSVRALDGRDDRHEPFDRLEIVQGVNHARRERSPRR